VRDLRKTLEQRQAASLYRRRRVIEGPQGCYVQCEGRALLSFCSNDYLGLANHPDVVRAFQRGAERYGVGSGAAHLVSGHSRAHHELEEALAAFVGRPQALLFSTGYMANLGVIAALAGRGSRVYEDRLNHASLLDGALLSGARLQRYRHADVAALDNLLLRSPDAERLVVTDGVFSMDGDLAPLAALAACCANHNAWLMVDDAHGLGVLGNDGRGTVDHFGLGNADVPILMGTLGKALGTFGAFVAGSEDLIETLIQQARSYIYTTALPPAVACATRESLNLLQREAWRREHLAQLIQRFRAAATALPLQLTNSPTPIQPLIVGDSARAVALSQALESAGVLIPAMRPPTVPEGSARLRITLSANHTFDEVERLVAMLAELL
jgi:8-amino-7-oxononanoate synthase